jgi:glutamine synthetase adenylyltransferase
MTDAIHLTSDLPDVDGPRRFLSTLEELHPRDAAKLQKNDGLLSDVLTLAAYSPLLSTTLLQNPEYLAWLNRKRKSPGVRTRDELLEALGRFVLTHSQHDLHTHLARFRRRELLRIFLGDIRQLATIAETTEDISNLADAILETALRAARQEMDNRFGQPQTVDEKGRETAAEFCIVSLGKLGSHELNYASDIDLLFLYSDDGETSGRGSRGKVTNREYFVKLGEAVTQIAGKHTGEGAAYRIDMRLRPHGRVGPLAISVDDATRYYRTEARDWERQVLIRSRASAGDGEVYKRFYANVESAVFSTDVTVESALGSVRRSKELIDTDQRAERGFNVKLGRGGIREIEFIAQALQIAYGGRDRWLRAQHTLISLSRLSDRNLIAEHELTELFNAYEFLRRLEHILQMENGLQTHTIPNDDRRILMSKRMRCKDVHDFEDAVALHTGNVHRVFTRVFSTDAVGVEGANDFAVVIPDNASVEAEVRSPTVTNDGVIFERSEYLEMLTSAIRDEADFRHRLGAFRRCWARLLQTVSREDLKGAIDIRSAKRAQTALAEASIETALEIARGELQTRYDTKIPALRLAVMGLGKLGGGSIDYESDLDLVLVYDDEFVAPGGVTSPEFFSRAAEIFVTTLSSMTRDGSIYRVDLRLRPYGKNGTSTISFSAFRDYMREKAAPWEWLAYVKIRGVAGLHDLAKTVEKDIREIIYARAKSTDPAELASDTRRMRLALEKERGGRSRTKEVDIKYGPGGMLDVYFLTRYLQLRDDIHDDPDDRTTDFMLGQLRDRGSIDSETYETLHAGYEFLSTLDHNLRLILGRTTRLTAAKANAIEAVASRMGLTSSDDLFEHLNLHRLNIRSIFDEFLNT